MSNGALVRRLLGLVWRYRIGCIRVVVQQAMLVVIGLGGLGLTGLAIDALRHHLDSTAAAPAWPLGIAPPRGWSAMVVTGAIAAAVLALAVMQAALRYRASVVTAQLVQRIVVQLRTDIYDKLQRLSFRFFDANQSGSIINRVTADAQAVRMFVDGVIIQMLVVGLSLAVYLAYMLSVNVPLTLACLATTPLLGLASVAFSRRVRPLHVRNRELADQMVLALSENVQGIQVVKGFARERDEIDKFRRANLRIRDGKQEIFWHTSIFQPITGILTQLNMVILLGYGGYLVVAGELRLGVGLFVFANLLTQFANQVAQITNIANSIQASLTGAARVFEVLDTPVEIASAPDAVRLVRARGEVRFEHVSFAYRAAKSTVVLEALAAEAIVAESRVPIVESDDDTATERLVLQEVDFAVHPGQCVAIVGATGSGKSTLLSLIPRFYDALAGRVLVDGIDVRRIDLDDLRRNVGLVFQESFLFSNTVSANIAFGHPEATREAIERAARLAAAHEFITELPHGYETIIGEHGCTLSGGQRQRLALARALLLDPPILVLDDATTAVDPETEHEILESLDTAMAGRTTLIVAHRMSTLRRADHIIVLDRGQIVQNGAHDDLFGAEGYYRSAAQAQLAEAVDDRPAAQSSERPHALRGSQVAR